MATVTLRPMTAAEFERWQETLAEEYANEQVKAGAWAQAGALQRAKEQNVALLPQGLDTPRMLFLHALDEAGSVAGRAWVSLDHPRGAPNVAFLYDIEVWEDRRGHGIGRALLDAVEDEVREAGADALELNVFGRNKAAVRLYETAGYHVITQQMRKAL